MASTGEIDHSNLDIVWNSSRFFTRLFKWQTKWATAALPPSKKAIILTCIDARIFPQQICGIQMGEFHVIRNAGGSAEAALRDIVVSQQLLGTDEIFILKHDGCGMLTGNNKDFLSILKQNSEDPNADFSPRGYAAVKQLEFFAIKDKGVEQALADDVQFLLAHPAVKKNTHIHGLIYDVSNGKTRQLFVDGESLGPDAQQELPDDPDDFNVEVAYEEDNDDPEYSNQLWNRVVGAHHMEAIWHMHSLEFDDGVQPTGATLGHGGSKAGSLPPSPHPTPNGNKVGPRSPGAALGQGGSWHLDSFGLLGFEDDVQLTEETPGYGGSKASSATPSPPPTPKKRVGGRGPKKAAKVEIPRRKTPARKAKEEKVGSPTRLHPTKKWEAKAKK